MQPLIGLTTSINDDESVLLLNRSYAAPLLAAGAVPIMLPPTDEPSVITRYIGMVDGLMLTGGGDVDPSIFGEQQDWKCGEVSPVRDSFELQLCRSFLASGNKPLLGICRGIQILNVALGGSLYQDLESSYPEKTIAHQQKQRSCYASHAVTLAQDSQLHKFLGEREIHVNSHHHQAVKHLSDSLISTAYAPDGVIEAVEMPEHPFCIGVQWHPERLWNPRGGPEHAHKLFHAFVQAASHR